MTSVEPANVHCQDLREILHQLRQDPVVGKRESYFITGSYENETSSHTPKRKLAKQYPHTCAAVRGIEGVKAVRFPTTYFPDLHTVSWLE